MSRYSRSQKQVRFNLPDEHDDQPPSILRRQTRGNIDIDPISAPPLSRRSSMPISSTTMSRSSRLRGLEALHGLREFLKDACNFHGEELRRALSVPSVNALCELTAFISRVRGNMDRSMTHVDEKVLRRLLDCSKRHPHEQFTLPDDFSSRHARNAMRAHRKRARREADFHLLQFVARQLRLPARALRELSTKQKIQREMEAFKERIKKFYGPRLGGNSSAPQSPAGRPLTTPRSPATDPLRWEMEHGSLSGKPHELFPEMEEISLPASYDRRTHPPRTPPLQPIASPYVAVHQTPPQTYQASPYVYTGVPVGGYPRTPPQAPVSVPYSTQYAQQAYVGQGQAFGPQPMNLPQAVGTPQQQASMPSGTIPIMNIPASMQSTLPPPIGQTIAHSHTPQQTTLSGGHIPPQNLPQAVHTAQTPQQQPLQHPVHTPQQTMQQPPLPAQGMTLPPSAQQTPQQPPLQHPQQAPLQHPQQAPLQHPQQTPLQHVNMPPSAGQTVQGGIGHPQVQTQMAAPNVPQSFGMTGATQQYVQGQYGSVGSTAYPQGQTGQVGQSGQMGPYQYGQYQQGYYSNNGSTQQQQQG